jgi:HK97 family phage portal protein
MGYFKNLAKAMFGQIDVPDMRASGAPGPEDDVWYQNQIGAGVAASGALVTADSAMRISAVFACVKVLAESVAMLPLVVYDKDMGRETPAANHPLHRLLARAPNEWQTSFQFRLMMMYHLALRGNAFAFKDMNYAGIITRLIPFHPDRVRVYRLPGVAGPLVYEVRDPWTSELTRYNQDQILHLRGLTSDGVIGLSPIAAQRETLGGALGAQDYANRMWANDAKPAGVITAPGKVSEQAAKNIKQSWQTLFSGPNIHKTAVLEEGMKYERIQLSQGDVQWLDTRKFQVNDIARIFRVPPHMIGDLTRSTNNNIEHQGIEFVTQALMPWIENWEQQICHDLMTPDEQEQYGVSFIEDALLRGDQKSRFDAYAVARQWGWMSANEIRRKERMQPLDADDGGDDYLRPMNFTVAGTQADQLADLTGQNEGDDAADATDTTDGGDE